MIRAKAVYTLRMLTPLVVFLALWQLASAALGEDKLPGLKETALAFVGSVGKSSIIEAQGGGSGGFLPHVYATFRNFSAGLLAGIVAGFVLALFIFQFKLVGEVLDPVLEMFRVLPPLIVVPFLLVIFPANDFTQVLIAGIYSAYSICIYTLNSLQNIERNYLQMADLLGSGVLQKVWKVEVPAVMPEFVGALRVTSPLTLGIVIVAEYLGSPLGIGRALKFATSYSRVDLIVVGIIWVIILATLVDVVLAVSFKFILRWSLRTTKTIQSGLVYASNRPRY
jgi:ABC-type nitrate/sulfonate/bicarbonate transport system permease component